MLKTPPANVEYRNLRTSVMSWKKSKFTSSFLSLFSDADPERADEERIEAVREAIHEALQDVNPGESRERVLRRVDWAPDAQALWYLRSEVMVILSADCGEAVARTRMQGITDMFKGLVPSGQVSRPSPLGRF
jgi:hypothetical protein